MKKLLLSISTLILVCLSAKAQFISSATVSIASTPDITAMTFVPGEDFSFDVSYEAEILRE